MWSLLGILTIPPDYAIVPLTYPLFSSRPTSALLSYATMGPRSRGP